MPRFSIFVTLSLLIGCLPVFAQFGQNTTLSALQPNSALDLGAYQCSDASLGCTRVTDFSGFKYDPYNHRMLMFGGGHAGSYRTDIDGFSLASLSWNGLYPSTPCSAMTPQNMNSDGAYWVSTGHPIARHTYDMMVVGQFGTLRRLVLVTNGGLTTGESCTGMFTGPAIQGKFAYFDLSSSGSWSYSNSFNNNIWYYAAAAEYDPVSQKILIVGPSPQGGAPAIWTYDPVADAVSSAGSAPSNTGYSNNLVYFPPSDKFYLIARGNPTKIFEIVPNRNSWSGTTITEITSFSGMAPVSQESGWAYDAANMTIGGGILNGVYFAFDPINRVWKSSTIQSQSSAGASVGTVLYHALDYDPIDSVFILMSQDASGVSRTWAYRPPAFHDPSGDTSPPTIPTGLTAVAVSASQVNLAWNASSDNVGVTGYGIFRNSVQVAVSLSTSYQDSNLSPLTPYSYTISAYDAAGNASGQSPSVSATTQSASDTTPPAISSISVTNQLSTSAYVNWSTNEAADSQVEYSTTPCPCNTNTAPLPTLATSHTVYLSALTPGTTYYFRVKSKDAAGNLAVSPSLSFITTAGTAAPPLPSFRLTSPLGGVLPFTVGLAFRRGDIPGVPVLSITSSQVIIKSRWADNSVKHAIASGHATLTGGGTTTISVLSADSAPGGTNLTASDIQTAAPSASVQLGTIGLVSLTDLLGAPFRTWISGPEMVEAHYRSGLSGDPTLIVWFHVQLYKGGRIFVRVVVENGFLDLTSVDRTYIPKVIIGGTTVFNNGGASLVHYAHTRWTAEGWIGGDPQVIPALDTAYLMETKLVPNYLRLLPSPSALDSLYQSYGPLQNGNWTPKMGNAGYQNQIGLLPLWDALYLTSNGDPRAFNSVLANAKALNSYPILWNDSVTKQPPLPSDRPTWTVYGPGEGGSTEFGAGPLVWDVAHHGSGGFLAYLITGDYYYLETMQDQSSLCYLVNSSSNGSGTGRRLLGQTRGAAWCQRTIGQLAAIAPSDPVTNDYRALLANNAFVWDQERQRAGQNQIGYLYAYEIASGAYGTGLAAPWQQNFLVQTYGYLSDLEPLSDMSSLRLVRDFLYRSVVGLLGSDGPDNYCYTKAASYTIKISDTTNGDSTTWYDSWGTVFQATYGSPNASCGSTLGGTSGGDPAASSTGYWGNLLPAIAYAVDHQAPGALAAWTRLINASNWPIVQNSGFNEIPIWGIAPRALSGNTRPRNPTNLVIKR